MNNDNQPTQPTPPQPEVEPTPPSNNINPEQQAAAPVTPSTPQAIQQPQAQIQPQASGQATISPDGDFPGKTLGIVGLSLSILGAIGVIISVIGLLKSKKAGFKNTPAFVGTIVSSVFTLIYTILLVMLFSSAYTIYDSCKSYLPGDEVGYQACVDYEVDKMIYGDNSATTKVGETLEYENEIVSFSHPSNWSVAPASDNFTFVDSNGVSAFIFENIKFGSTVSANYAAFKYGGKSSYEMSEIRDLMQPAVSQYTATSAKNLNATTGFGCAIESTDFSFISAPKYIEKDNLAGIEYTFECTGFSGKVKGAYYTTYDTLGNRHTLAGTVLDNETGSAELSKLESMIDSFQMIADTSGASRI